MHNTDIPDLARIRRQAKALRKTDAGSTYMQHLDQVARELYGVRHFHEARARAKLAATTVLSASPLQYYLRSVQEYYLDF